MLDVICFANGRGAVSRFRLGPAVLLTVLAGLSLGAVGLVYLGYSLGQGAGSVAAAATAPLPAAAAPEPALPSDFEAELDALALRSARVQARILRLDALGQRLVAMADLDPREFDFSREPPLGGPESPSTLYVRNAADLLAGLGELEARAEQREQQLGVLERFFLEHRLLTRVLPEGSPVEGGWISSHFGLRTDPITGRKAFHHGVDFVGPTGAPVRAVADGIVSFSGTRPGYGRIVELEHGNGISTRYAHNQANLVQVGEKVEKGQAIARLGQSGRATGPHVHFEVVADGEPVDPMSYVLAGR